MPSIVEDIVSLARSMELDACYDDVVEIVKAHNEELTTKDLHELEKL